MELHAIRGHSTEPAGANGKTQPAARPLGQRSAAAAHRLMMDAFLAEKLIAPQLAAPLLHRCQSGSASALIELLVVDKVAALEEILGAIVQRSGRPYVPLAQYTVCDNVVRLLPADFCVHHHVVPFDRISQAVLMATANPFDQPTHREVEQRLNCRVFWSVTAPADITALLERVHGTHQPRKAA